MIHLLKKIYHTHTLSFMKTWYKKYSHVLHHHINNQLWNIDNITFWLFCFFMLSPETSSDPCIYIYIYPRTHTNTLFCFHCTFSWLHTCSYCFIFSPLHINTPYPRKKTWSWSLSSDFSPPFLLWSFVHFVMWSF